jgi:site-specific recombinase XerD
VPYATPTVEALLGSWQRSLRARNRSQATIGNYAHAVRIFTAWSAEHSHPTDPTDQTSGDIEAWFAHQLEHGAASSSVNLRFACLRQWFGWLVEEDELDVSPMAKLKPPKLTSRPVPVLSDSDLKRLLDDCAGKDWADRRDLAIIRLFIDTGMRLGEMASIRLAELDLDRHSVVVNGKSGPRLAPFGDNTAAALDRYIRARARRPHASSPALWIGLRGTLGGDGIAAMIKTRGKRVGLPGMHAHLFRHAAAHYWLASGGQELDLARIAGWAPGSAMLAHYGASAAAERAREAHKRLAPGDRM